MRLTETLAVDGLVFEVTRSDRRRTAALLVERDGRLAIQAPADVGDDELANIARSRLEWVHRKMGERLGRASAAPKEYVAGESFLYLGRRYRLAFVQSLHEAEPAISLKHGRLEMARSRRDDAETVLKGWYRRRGQAWLPTRLRRWAARCGVEDPELNVRDLGYRWASRSESGVINVHWQAIALPPSVIDYLLVHELTHAHHANHDRAFRAALSRVMPEADARRDWLRSNGTGW